MSDAKDNADVPAEGDELREQPVERQTSDESPTDPEQMTRAEYRASTGEQPIVAGEPATETPVADAVAEQRLAADEGSAADVDEPAAEPAGAPAGADESAGGVADPVAGESTESGQADAQEEPDYEALAAELDRLEAETAAAAPVAPGAPEPQPTKEPWFEPSETRTFQASEPDPEPRADPAETVTASEPTRAPSPIFVQAPEPPRKRGNRGAAGLIGLVAAVAFGALFLVASSAIWWFYAALGLGMTDASDPLGIVLETVVNPAFWVTVIAFWLAFWLLGVFVNRARWWSWVVLGFLVALLTYAGYLAGLFAAAPFWMITQQEGVSLLVDNVLSPVALASFILAREVTIWFGAWVSRRGARIAAQNAEAQEEYERVLADGPQASSER